MPCDQQFHSQIIPKELEAGPRRGVVLKSNLMLMWHDSQQPKGGNGPDVHRQMRKQNMVRAHVEYYSA